MMQRALAREAEAERERRAKVISAHGELQSPRELREAAEELGKAPAAPPRRGGALPWGGAAAQ